MNPAKTYTAITDWLLIGMFMGFIFTPLLLSLSQPDKVYSEAEKRPLSEFPQITGSKGILDFARSFDAYYQDHFGLREVFIHRYHREMKKRFNGAGNTEVVTGNDGWLYYAGEDTLDDFLGRRSLTVEQLAQFSQRLADNRAWLAGQGIEYLAVIAPNKQSIYPDYLPEYYRKEKQETRFDQVMQEFAAKQGNLLIDLRPPLLAQKDNKRLYDKTDTHWNYLGAYFGYREIMQQVGSMFPGHDFAGYFNVGTSWQEEEAGDLATLSGRQNELSETRPIIFAWIQAKEKKLENPLQDLLLLNKLQPYYTEREGRTLRALVLHDSFINPMKVFLSESFAEVLYVWKYFDNETMAAADREVLQQIIDEYQPDIVLDEIVERHLSWWAERPEERN